MSSLTHVGEGAENWRRELPRNIIGVHVKNLFVREEMNNEFGIKRPTLHVVTNSRRTFKLCNSKGIVPFSYFTQRNCEISLATCETAGSVANLHHFVAIVGPLCMKTWISFVVKLTNSTRQKYTPSLVRFPSVEGSCPVSSLPSK